MSRLFSFENKVIPRKKDLEKQTRNDETHMSRHILVQKCHFAIVFTWLTQNTSFQFRQSLAYRED